MTASINYGHLMHEAMRGLIREVLRGVEKNGLPGAHHFFITFNTRHPDVQIADWLRERYQNDMTVVMQNWYEDLEVGEDGFGITLNFGDEPEHLSIPFDAILTFVDPSVEFGLRFEVQTEDDEDEAVDDDTDDTADPPARDAEIVQLDIFRKT